MNWTIDYGSGPVPCEIPHSWGQSVDVRWEGPATYQTEIQIDRDGLGILFHGVSYEAKVWINSQLITTHKGIWDAFVVEIPKGIREAKVQVEVTKNGGKKFPVKDVLSGFLPYVFHTFGGIFRPVEVIDLNNLSLILPAPHQRVNVDHSQLLIDGEPWFMRGILSWGWYPELGHPHPSREMIQREIRAAKSLGFNLIKFCLWLPPHEYFKILEEEEMWAWVELPLWMPTGDENKLSAMLEEIETIVMQYRHHDRIIAWTCGCELSESTSHEYREKLVRIVSEATNCPLIKDNSGGSEMYGGDLREYGSFYDFHPYCDTHFYQPVLESLAPNGRNNMPVLLGEFNDYDSLRSVNHLVGEETIEMDQKHPWIISSYNSPRPYWLSSLPELNDQGVRWQHDVPGALDSFVAVDPGLKELSETRSRWIRNKVFQIVASMDFMGGFVQTGIADTPISTSGMLAARMEKLEDFTVYLLPFRNPPWVNGGNRPGWRDPQCVFPGASSFQVGLKSVHEFHGEITIWWKSSSAQTSIEVRMEALKPRVVHLESKNLSSHDILCVQVDGKTTEFPIFVYEKLSETYNFSPEEQLILEINSGVFKSESVPTIQCPFWRECVVSGQTLFSDLPQEFYWSIAPDRAIDPGWLSSEMPNAEWLLTRTDTRTYKQLPYVVRDANRIVTTLRPWGGHGSQPFGLNHNPAGCELLRILQKLTHEG